MIRGALVAVLSTLAACQSTGDCLLVMHLSGNIATPIDHVTVADRDMAAKSIQVGHAPVTLPASLAIEVPRREAGALNLFVSARDAEDRPLADGSASVTVAPGKRSDIDVQLFAVVATLPVDMASQVSDMAPMRQLDLSTAFDLALACDGGQAGQPCDQAGHACCAGLRCNAKGLCVAD